MSEPTIDDIAARHAAATRGPWGWRGNLDTHNIHLRSLAPDSMRPDVLRFHRSGFSGGKPVFNVPEGDRGFINVHTADLVVFDVCRSCTDRYDTRVYRRDIVGIRHPDAELIAHSWEDIDVLLRRVRALEAELAAAREVCHEPLS